VVASRFRHEWDSFVLVAVTVQHSTLVSQLAEAAGYVEEVVVGEKCKGMSMPFWSYRFPQKITGTPHQFLCSLRCTMLSVVYTSMTWNYRITVNNDAERMWRVMMVAWFAVPSRCVPEKVEEYYINLQPENWTRYLLNIYQEFQPLSYDVRNTASYGRDWNLWFYIRFT
jgi:hypothetical protein